MELSPSPPPLLSPPSPSPLLSLLHALLSLAAAGTRGPTLDELLDVLASAGGAGATADDVAFLAAHVVGHVLADASAAGGPCVSIANGVCVDASLSLKAAFAEITACAYNAKIQSVNFQTKVIEVKSDGTMSRKKIDRRQLLKSSGMQEDRLEHFHNN